MKTSTATKAAPVDPITAVTLPALAAGEKYAGFLIDESGRPSHHVILLPGATTATWKKAVEWAKKQGGELPTRREQSLLFANCKAEFEQSWYWSGEQCADDGGYAWLQYFDGGGQYGNDVSGRCRARAVRRSPLQ